MLSILITARNEVYLEKTIRNVLDNAKGEIEILVALDGYLPEPQIVLNDNRVIFVHYEQSIGQRQAINALARMAKGKFIMKLDAHCAVDEGFDVKLAEDCEYEWTVVPRMYNLDIETFKPKLHKRTDYMYIKSLNSDKPFRAEYYTGSEHKRQHSKSDLIDDTMACMGPCWFMHKDRFFEQGGCDEGHGSWGAMSVEVACKAWMSGGALKVNKKTWFAHWFRGHIGFPYSIRGSAIEHARAYSREQYLNNKWNKAVRKFEWIVEKFNPPTWEGVIMVDEKKRLEFNGWFYRHIHREQHPVLWKGIRVLKMPTDMMLYHKVIFENKPDYIVEIGTKYGGSALFFQDTLDMNGHGKVITIDIKDVVKHKDPRITYLLGGSLSEDNLNKIRELKGKVMVVIDGNHGRRHVKWELYKYAPLVTSGQYMVVEDCYTDHGLYGPGEARDWFLRNNKDFVQTDLDKYFLIGICMGGWLRKK